MVSAAVVLKLVERFPIIIQLAPRSPSRRQDDHSEPLLDTVFDPNAVARWSTYAVCIAGVLGAGWWVSRAARGPARAD